MRGQMRWNGKVLPFTPGETLAQALLRAGHLDFGFGPHGRVNSMFCGIGQCQNCIVAIDGIGPREACLTLCQDGLVANPMGVRRG